MTLGIAAKFKGGIVCATDLAVSSGEAKRQLIEGKWWLDGSDLVLFAGTLYYVQEVQFADADLSLRERLQLVREHHKDDEDKDDCELLRIHDGRITFYEHFGSFYDCGDYGCIGSGADLADGLLEMVYTTGRSEAWMRGHLDNIFRIAAKKVEGVSREWKHKVIYDG